jgi:hypothetical protein
VHCCGATSRYRYLLRISRSSSRTRTLRPSLPSSARSSVMSDSANRRRHPFDPAAQGLVRDSQLDGELTLGLLTHDRAVQHHRLGPEHRGIPPVSVRNEIPDACRVQRSSVYWSGSACTPRCRAQSQGDSAIVGLMLMILELVAEAAGVAACRWAASSRPARASTSSG